MATLVACGGSHATQDTVVLTPSVVTAPPPGTASGPSSHPGGTGSRPSPSAKDAPPPPIPEPRVQPLYGGPPPDLEGAFV